MAASDAKIQTCDDCNHPERRRLGVGKLTRTERRRLINDTKRANGCIGAGAKNKPHKHGRGGYQMVDGTTFWICPRLVQKDPQLGVYMQSYLWYEHKGTMPVTGGLNDQPEKWVQAMEVIRTEFRKIERYENEQQRRKMERKSKASPRGR